MTEVKVLPVVEHDPDKWGLPGRLTIPARLTRPVAVIASGRRIGEVAIDGKVKWVGPNAAANYHEYGLLSDALRKAATARGQLRVAIIDGAVTSVVVPTERERGGLAPASRVRPSAPASVSRILAALPNEAGSHPERVDAQA